jgi:hypothetical protein
MASSFANSNYRAGGDFPRRQPYKFNELKTLLVHFAAVPAFVTSISPNASWAA